MSIELIVGLLVLAVIALAAGGVYVAATVRDLRKAIENTAVALMSLQQVVDEAMANAQSLSLAAKLAQVTARQETVERWRAELAKHPDGSPKHTAYSNRLREIGAL